MAHHYSSDSSHTEYGTHFSIEYASCFGSCRTEYVDSFVVKAHIV